MRFSYLMLLGVFVSPVVSFAQEKVDYNRDIKPILSKNCFACHGPDEGHRSAQLRLDTFADATAPRKKGAAVVPKDQAKSRLLERITDHESPMPPKKAGEPLTEKQVALLKKWIDQGAEYAPHWAFVKPTRPTPPKVSDARWNKNPVDQFIFESITKANLKPSPEADKFVLLRRLSIDLRGVPPTPQEVEAFSKDTSPNAYEKMVDLFLKDNAYGERMARVWLDLARYADSAGYGSDPLRLNMWRYRDWVIDSFNKNMPYDQFTIEQLAGDLLPSPTIEQKIATAFHRNTQTNTEGGTDDEEYRVVAIKDRTDTTFQVWMALSVGCAKCHTHKFDPISQKEYYRLYAIFNQTADSDRGDEFPTMPAPTTETQEKIKVAEAKILELKKKLEANSPEIEIARVQWEKSLAPILKGMSFDVTKSTGITRNHDKWELKGTGTIEGLFDGPALTGVRLQQLGKDALPDKLSLTVGKTDKPTQGKFVRVEVPNSAEKLWLALAEVQVFNGTENVARKGKAKQSSTDYGGDAARAIDGETNGEYFVKNSVSHTGQENNPWWEVELPALTNIDKITLWNRTDGGTSDRLNRYKISILDEKRNLIWSNESKTVPRPSISFTPNGVRSPSIADTYLEADGSRVFVFAEPLAFSKDPFTMSLTGNGTFAVTGISESFANRLSVPAPVRMALAVPVAQRTPAHTKTINDHYISIAPERKALRDELAKLEKEKPVVPTIPIMQELAEGKQRKTKLMIKGDFLNLGEEVTAGLPTAFHKAPDGKLDRLALAKWIMSEENPMTARVAVNRWWSLLFGKGLVETEEDFGIQGEQSSHPELLDWLATEYIRMKWDTKGFIKMLVMSETYKQSSKVLSEHLEKDPLNKWLARAPRFRLEAETVRDQALSLSGLLSGKLGGPSVYPPQPSGLWQAAFNGQRSYPTSTGEDKYRRGLYTIWRRTIPYPSMTTFDAPSRETCTVRRIRTNTPLQAFVTLNDPVYVEAAQALARRIAKEGGTTVDSRLSYGLSLVLCRPTQEAQLKTVKGLYEKELARLQKDAQSTKALLGDNKTPLPNGLTESELAAITVVANVLLNLDAVLTK